MLSVSGSGYYYESDSESYHDDEIARIIEIDLNDNSAARTLNITRRNTTSNFHHGDQTPQERIDIAAALLQNHAADQDPPLRVITRPIGINSLRSRERWFHIATQSITFENFKRIVVNITLEHHDNLTPVVLYLLKDVKNNFERSSAHSSYIEPGTIVRCDGIDRADTIDSNQSALFVAFPYLDTGKISHGQPLDKVAHYTRSLFQQLYPQEDTRDRDLDQQFGKFQHTGYDQVLRVPQLWAVILDSTTIITCGPEPLASMTKGWLDFTPEGSLLDANQCMIQVTDPSGRITLLPAAHCRSFLALRRNVQRECLNKDDAHIDQYTIHVGDSEEVLDPANWPEILRNIEAAFLEIRLVQKRRNLVEPSGNKKTLEAPPSRQHIEYADLDSDNETVTSKEDAARWALMDLTSKPERKSKVAASVRTRRNGHSCDIGAKQKPTAMRSDPPQEERAKVFRRLTVDEAEAAEHENAVESSSDTDSESDPGELLSDVDDVDSDAQSDGSYQTNKRKSDLPIEETFQIVSKRSSDSAIENPTSAIRSGRFASVADDEDDAVAGAEPSGLDWRSQGSERLAKQLRGASIDLAMESVDMHNSTGQPLVGLLQIQPVISREPTVDRSDDENEQLSRASLKAAPIVALTDSPASIAELNSSEPKFTDVASETRTTDQQDVQSTSRRVGTATGSSFPEQDIKEIVREEIAAALKRNEDEIESQLQSRIEQEMRSRLVQLGFSSSQVDAMLRPGVAANPPPMPHPSGSSRPQQPTYAKINRQYLDIETLLYYDIPFEIDTDPDYVIVLREMSQAELDVVFEHTRRRRENVLQEDGAQSFPKARRARPRTPPNQNPYSGEASRTVRTPNHESLDLRRGLADALHEEWEDPAEDRVQHFDHSLKVIPFLAWPTTTDLSNHRSSIDTDKKRSVDIEGDEELRINLTLMSIKRHIYRASEKAEANDAINLTIYNKDQVIVAISTDGCSKKSLGDIPATLEVDGRVRNQGDVEPTKPPSKPSTEVTEPSVSIGADAASSMEAKPAERAVISWQINKLSATRDSLVSATRELISQFVPLYSKHTLVQRCWGTLSIISKQTMSQCASSNRRRLADEAKHSTAIFVIKDITDKDYLAHYGIVGLTMPIKQCTECSRERRYPDIDDAIEHLRRHHTKSQKASDTVAKTDLDHWLVPTTSLASEEANMKLLNFLGTLLRCTRKLLAKSIHIRSSVAEDDGRMSSKYLLPRDLVRAAEHIFQFIYYSGHCINMIREDRQIPGIPKDAPVLFGENTDVTGAEYFAKVADLALSNARDELMLMAHTGKSRDLVIYDRIMPDTIALMTFIALAKKELSITTSYHEHLVRLRYEASRKPSKRVLRDVYLWKEELEVVTTVIKQQKVAFAGLDRLLMSSSFPKPDPVRLDAWARIESFRIESLLRYYNTTYRKRIRGLYREADKLAESLRHNIDIAEEGDSKAILIFTLVTIVFLPLSFVSSVFGMNTVDVRDMSSSQGLFWAVALPVTAAVGGLSMLAAYGGSWTQRRLQDARRLRRMEWRMPSLGKNRYDDEEHLRLGAEKAGTREDTSASRRRKIAMEFVVPPTSRSIETGSSRRMGC